ncbi:MAG: hypothetical protein IT349_02245 [Candidatus Eisenbacteria bacterium]|nr:hypothetical protein [Candidatus Eisenbacteria bacterium]
MNPPRVIEAHGKHAQAVRYTRDGALLVSVGMDAKIRLWRRPDYTPAGLIEGHEKSVNTLAFDRDESHLATASSDGSVRVWSFPAGFEISRLRGMTQAAFHPNASILATLSTKSRVVFSATTTGIELGSEIVADQRLFAIAWSIDGATLWIGGTGAIHRFAIELGKGEVVAHPLPAAVGHDIAVTALLALPDGETIASTGADGTLRLWSAATGLERLRVEVPLPGVLQLATSPDGGRIYLSSDHRILGIRAMNGATEVVLPVELKGVYGIAVSPDGADLAMAGADGKVRVWDLREEESGGR